jgi:hypothetical protein
MMLNENKPYLYFWITAVVFLLYGLLSKPIHALGINLFDRYFVVSYSFIAIAVAVLLLMIGFIGWTTQKLRHKK